MEPRPLDPTQILQKRQDDISQEIPFAECPTMSKRPTVDKYMDTYNSE